MGRYISQSDVEDKFGASNVALWSNLEGANDDANTARITKAITIAEQIVDDRFRGSRYAVPLSGSSGAMSIVGDWAAALAGVWLYTNRGVNHGDSKDADRVLYVQRVAMEDMDAYLAGQRTLDCSDARPNGTDAPFVVG